MQDERKMKKDLINEIRALRQQVADMSATGRGRKKPPSGEENFKALAENANDGILISIQGRYVYVNRKTARMTGYSPLELRQMTIEDITHPSQAADVIARYKRRLAGKSAPRQYETVIVRKDGSSLPIELTAARTTWCGQPAGLAIIRDISGRKQEEQKRQAALQERASIVDAMGDALIVFDMDGTIIDVNPVYERLTGLKKKDVIGRNGAEVAGKTAAHEEMKRITDVFRKTLKGKEIPPIQTVMVNQKGEENHVYLTTTFIRDERERPQKGISIIKNINDLVRTERGLLDTEKLYHSTIDWLDVILHVVDPDLRITLHNKAFSQWCKKLRLRQDAVGQGVFEIFPFLPEKVRDEYQQVFDTGQPLITEETTSVDDQIFVTETRKIPVREGDKVVRVITIIRDITDKKRAETALLESQRRYRAIVQDQTDMICRFLPDWKLTFVNDAYCQAFNMNREDLIGRTFLTLIPKEDQKRVKENIASLTRKNPIQTQEHQVFGPGGQIRWQQWINRAIFDRDGHLVEYQSVGRDITKRKQAEESVLREREYFRAFVASLDDWAWEMDREGHHTYSNPAVEKILGYTVDEVVGFHTTELWPDQDRTKKNFNKLKRTLRSGKAWKNYECRFKHKNASTVFMESTAIPIFDSQNQLVGYRGIDRDITDRKRAEDELRRYRHQLEKMVAERTAELEKSQEELRGSKDRLQIIFDFAPEAYYLTDITGRFLDGNKAAEEMSGYDREELIGKTVVESGLLPPEEIQRAIALLRKNARGQTTGPTDFTVIRKDGHRVPMEITSFPTKIKDQTVILNIARDVTAQKTIQRKLKENEALFRSTFEQAAVGMNHIALDGHFLRVNEKFCDIVGYSKAELLKRRFQDITHPEDLPANLALRKQLLNGEISQLAMEKRYIHRDGYPVWVHLTATIVRDASGQPDHFICVVEDIGIRKWTEEELIRTGDRLKILFEYAPDAYLLTDEHGHIIDCNRVVEELTGYVKKELCGRNLLKSGLLVDEELPKVAAFLKEVSHGRPLGPQEFSFLRPDGERLLVEISAFGVEIEGQTQILLIAHDITERKMSQRHLQVKAHLLDVLRGISDIDQCLQLGCQAIRDARLYHRAVMTLHGEKGVITHLGQMGLDPNIVEQARKSPPPDEALREKMMAKDYRMSHSYFVPAEAGLPLNKTQRYIPQDPVATEDFNTWKAGDELFVPIMDMNGRTEGYVSVDTPCNGRRPDLGTILFLEDVVDIVARQIHEIWNISQLKESEETIRALMNATNDSAVLTDSQSHILALNEAAAQRLGQPAEDLIGRDGFSLFPPQVAGERRKKLLQVVRTKKPTRFQDERDGLFFDTTLFPVVDRQGQVARVAVFAHDVTAEVKARKALQQSEQKYRELLELLPVTVFELDLKGRILTTNRAGLQAFGYQPEDLDNGIHVDELYLPEERERIRRNIARKLRGETFQDHEYMALRKDGTSFPVIISSDPILRDGKVIGLRGVVVDITERKRIETAHRASEEKFRAIAENVPDIIFQTDRDGRIIYLSPAVEDLFGFRSEKGEGKLFHTFLVKREVARALAKFFEVLKGQPVRNFQLDMVRADKTVFPAELSATPIIKDTKVIGTQGIIRDISEQVRYRQELERSSERLRSIFNLAPDAMITLDLRGMVTSCNPAFLQLFGIAEEAVLGRHYLKNPTLSRQDRERYEQAFDDLFSRKPLKHVELEWTDRKGKKRFVDIHAARLLEGRKKVGLLAILRDITRQKMAAEALRQSEAAYRNLVELAPDAIVGFDRQGLITSCNSAALKTLGLTSERRLLGKHFSKLSHLRKTDVPRFKRLFAAVIEGKDVPPVEFATRRKDGTTRWAEGLYMVMKEDGEVVGVQAIIRDISARKRQEQIQKTLHNISAAIYINRDLKGLYQIIHNEMSRRLNTKNISISLFDSERKMISVEYHVDEKDHFQGELPAGKSLTAYMLKSGQPMLLTGKKIHELKRAGKVRPLGAPTKAWMGVPLKVEGRTIGALVVNDYRNENAFDRQDLELMELVSGQVALAIEHARVDQSLRESEELFRTLAEHSPHMIYLNKMGPILYANKKCEEILGYQREEFYHPDFNFLKLVAPEFREPMKTYFKKHKKGREVPPYRSALLTKQGQRVDVHSTTKLIQYRGEPVLLGILTEIS